MKEGKTKQILDGPEPGTVVLRAKDALTGGDAARVAEIDSIGALKTAQTVAVFDLLGSAGVPTAFLRRLDERSMLCADCDMIPVEFVVRRFGWGSYLRRNPAAAAAQRFDELVVERFHKHAMVLPPAAAAPELIDEGAARERFLRDGVWADGVFTDPYVEVRGDRWFLHSAKEPIPLGRDGFSIDAPVPAETDDAIVQTILLPAFRALEQAWQGIETDAGPIVLVDCKFEVRVRRSDGALVLADVVDNDSWRIWPGGDPARQLDKQTFRDGAPVSQVAQAYALVTELTSRFVAGGVR